MGAFNSHIGPVGRLLAACSPESSVGVQQNRRLASEMEHLFDSRALEFDIPDQDLRTLAVELTSPIVLASGGPDSQNFGALWLNRDADERTVLRLTGFQENITELDAQMRAYALALSEPDAQILIVDTPSHGLSDDYTDEQRRVMFTTGDLTNSGQPLTKAIARHIHDQDMPLAIDGSAISYGARMLLEVAKHGIDEGIIVGQAVAYELPGTVPARIRTHSSYFLYEWMQDRMRFSTDWLEGFKKQFATYLDTFGNIDRPRDLPNFLSRDKRAVMKNFWNSVLGMPTGLETMLEVIERGTDVIRVNGDSSRVTRASDALLQHELGGQTLYLLSHMPHGGIGHVVTSPVLCDLDYQLRRYPQDHGIHEISPFDYVPPQA